MADSLPDRFGNAVIDRWLISQGRPAGSFTSLERLCYTGTRGMGALEYYPSTAPQSGNDDIDINEMVKLSSQVLNEKTHMELPEISSDIGQLVSIGSSAGGARAKAVIAVNRKDGRIRSGQTDAGTDYDYWLIKFDGVSGSGDHGVTDPKQFTKTEYAYYLMAKDSGIIMSECRLLEKDGCFHFMTKRFDRENGNKIHMQTLAALVHLDYNIPRQCSYEQYADYAKRLGLGLSEIKQIYRRMVFSVLACNCDDHVKNFSFLMDRRGNWSLSPAYDITFAYAPGNRWISEHQMTINGKASGIGYNDLIQCGRSMGVPAEYCRKTIEAVSAVVENFSGYAEKCGIDEERIKTIDNILKTVRVL